MEQKEKYNNSIPTYIHAWLDVIESMQNENTYKLAWGRAILECIYTDKCYEINGEKVIIELNNIAKYMLKYYWNQIFFFNLKQAPISAKQPVIANITLDMINEYKKMTDSAIPVWFDEALKVFGKTKYYDSIIKKIVKILPENVSWRFKMINGEEVNLYEYDNKNRSDKVVFLYDEALLLKEYSIIISKLLNYKWTQLLEKYNYAPKIASKVNGISEAKLRRNSLTKYKNELLKQFEDGIPRDFYTNEPLDLDDISVDHVIPWSFMYSDDIWNLVLTSKSNNSSKSNSIPSEKIIEKLKDRNIHLTEYLDAKFKIELEDSIKNNYVDKYYFECRM